MEKYKISMVPGPVHIPAQILKAGAHDFGSADLEEDFFALYKGTQAMLQRIMKTRSDIVIQTGEGMLALWSALKSTLNPGDRVLAISTGIFGHGIGQMAEAIGCEVHTIGFGFDESANDYDLIEKAIIDFRPKMITMVQNETPSGVENPVEPIGLLKQKHNIPLLYVDAVSGIGGSEVLTDKWNIDLCLGATQKCLSAPANLSFLSVSTQAWEIIEQVNYVGYDALLPFKDAVKNHYFPYTPYWQGIAQLHEACQMLLEEGLTLAIERHKTVAEYCRTKALKMGLKLFPAPDATPSSTVTAIYVPENMTWQELDTAMREKGIVLGGNYGCLDGEVFRIGHMGSQANKNWVKETMDTLAEILKKEA
ncbi:MAG: pyridoxal-phosphate-dependent aminotransferase family protein [Marinifilaceae bacterium]